MDLKDDTVLLRERANLLKALSNPVRLCIAMELFQKGSCNVTAMQKCLELTQSTASQHLGRLRDMGIISGERKGTEVYYSITDETVKKILRVLFQE